MSFLPHPQYPHPAGSSGSLTAEAGTVLLKDINPSGDSSLSQLTHYRDSVVFTATDGSTGFELWKTDGTTSGTVIVADINPGSDNSDPGGYIIFNDMVFFGADDGTHGRELWLTQGNPGDTALVADINPGNGSFNPELLHIHEGRLYFRGDAGDGTGTELWVLYYKGPSK